MKYSWVFFFLSFFVPLFTPDNRRKNVSRPKVPVLEACRKGLSLASWGVKGNALHSSPTPIPGCWWFFFSPQHLLNFSSESWDSTCFFQASGIQIVVHNLVSSPLGIRISFQRCAFPSEDFGEG